MSPRAESTASIASHQSSSPPPASVDARAELRAAMARVRRSRAQGKDAVLRVLDAQRVLVSKVAAAHKAQHAFLKRSMRKRCNRLNEQDRIEDAALRNACSATATTDTQHDCDAGEECVVPIRLRLPLDSYLPRRVRSTPSVYCADDIIRLLPSKTHRLGAFPSDDDGEIHTKKHRGQSSRRERERGRDRREKKKRRRSYDENRARSKRRYDDSGTESEQSRSARHSSKRRDRDARHSDVGNSDFTSRHRRKNASGVKKRRSLMSALKEVAPSPPPVQESSSSSEISTPQIAAKRIPSPTPRSRSMSPQSRSRTGTPRTPAEDGSEEDHIDVEEEEVEAKHSVVRGTETDEEEMEVEVEEEEDIGNEW